VIRLAGACTGLLLAAVAVAAAPGDFAFGIPIEASGPEALLQLELTQAVYERVVRDPRGSRRRSVGGP
jgi:hypothetical protein